MLRARAAAAPFSKLGGKKGRPRWVTYHHNTQKGRRESEKGRERTKKSKRQPKHEVIAGASFFFSSFCFLLLSCAFGTFLSVPFPWAQTDKTGPAYRPSVRRAANSTRSPHDSYPKPLALLYIHTNQTDASRIIITTPAPRRRSHRPTPRPPRPPTS